MNQKSSFDMGAKSIPFELHGHHGKAAVYYGINADPVKAGFDFMPGMNIDIDLCRGYPIIQASIENYAGSGYRMLCGWIQIITSVYSDSHVEGEAQTKTYQSVDVAPSMGDVDLPFATFGILPQWFDAPCLNLGESASLHWTADTFLTTFPIRSRNEEISWLLGFRWGYIENDIPEQKPVILPLEVTDGQVWNRFVPFLRQEYKNWRFRNA